MPDPHDQTLDTGTRLTLFPLDDPAVPCVVVFPGGGYQGLADHEGAPVARWLNGLGVASAVLYYRHAPRFRHPAPLEDALAAVRLVRGNGAAKVGVLGFSAGGHLAATVSTQPDDRGGRPDLAILCYPVITLVGPKRHDGSRRALLGDRAGDEKLAGDLSAQNRVDLETPPTFLWHTERDPAVPVENSLMYADALRGHGRPFGLHVIDSDAPHGVGMADGDPLVHDWTYHCGLWLASRGFGGAK